MSNKTKPTIEEIKELKALTRKHYSNLHSEFQTDEDYFNLDFLPDLGLPVAHAAEGTILPTGRDVIQTAKAHIDTTNPRVFVTAVGTGRAAEEEAEMRQKFYQGIAYRTMVESPTSPFEAAVKNLCLYGLAGLKVVYDPDRWPDKPEKRDGETGEDYSERMSNYEQQRHDALPIVIVSVHPSALLFDPSYWHSAFVIECHSKLVLDISKRWPNWFNAEDKRPTDLVDYDEYWDEEWRSILIDGQPVLRGEVVRHKYGFMPYAIAYSGLGMETAANYPEHKAVGLLRYIRGVLASESRAYSIYDVVLKGTAWPVKAAEGDNANLLTDFKLEYGTIQKLPPGVKLVDVISPPPTDALLGHLQYTNSIISASVAPRSVRGMAEPGVRSGYDRSLIIEKAELNFGVIKQAAEKLIAQALSMSSKVLERVVPGNVSVWAKTPVGDYDVEIKKDRIKGHLCSVEFRAVREEQEMRQSQNAQQLVAAGLISRDTARRKYLESIDAEGEEMKIDAEKIRNSPPVQEVLAQAIAQELAQALGVRTQEQQMAGQRKGAGQPPPGIPGIPPRPPTMGSPEEVQQTLEAEVATPPVSPAPPGMVA